MLLFFIVNKSNDDVLPEEERARVLFLRSWKSHNNNGSSCLIAVEVSIFKHTLTSSCN